MIKKTDFAENRPIDVHAKSSKKALVHLVSSWSWFSVGFEENLPLTKPCDDRKRFFSVALVEEKRDGNGAFPIIVIHWDPGSFFRR